MVDVHEPSSILQDVTCLGCGCFCDDLFIPDMSLTTDRADVPCNLAKGWFNRLDRTPVPNSVARAGKSPIGFAEAVSLAVDLLLSARAPVFTGLAHSSNEAVAEALALADEFGAVAELGGRVAPRVTRQLAFQSTGRVSATLGEVKNRAELVIFWECDPTRSHPRHLERYSGNATGRFIPNGRSDRTIFAITSVDSDQPAFADHIVRVSPSGTLDFLRDLHQHAHSDTHEAGTNRGCEIDRLLDLVSSASYTAWFYDATRLSLEEFESFLRMVRDFNRVSRHVAIPIGNASNSSGAESVFASQTGYPDFVDFSLGFPRYLPAEASLENRLKYHTADLAFVFSLESTNHLALANTDCELIVCCRAGEHAPANSSLELEVATLGIDEEGTVARCDGVFLPVKSVTKSGRPTQRAWLRAIREEMAARRLQSHVKRPNST